MIGLSIIDWNIIKNIWIFHISCDRSYMSFHTRMKYLLSRSYLFSYVPHVLITKNFIYVPSGSLNRSSLYLYHSSFRSASLSRGQFLLRISARTTTWANRWIWHIVPTDRLNDLINILLHTTFTLRVLFVLSRRMASRTVFISIH